MEIYFCFFKKIKYKNENQNIFNFRTRKMTSFLVMFFIMIDMKHCLLNEKGRKRKVEICYLYQQLWQHQNLTFSYLMMGYSSWRSFFSSLDFIANEHFFLIKKPKQPFVLHFYLCFLTWKFPPISNVVNFLVGVCLCWKILGF